MKNLIALLIVSACLGENQSAGEELAAAEIYVIDGDSVRIDGENTRLMGLDTPETFQPKCEEERIAGFNAKENLRVELDEAEDIHIVYETKRNGELRLDKYGRRLGVLYIDGVDAAQIQVSAGMAREYDGGRRESWCST